MIAFLNMLMGTEPTIGTGNMKFEHKVMEHSGITSRASKPKKPGRGHPAKNYDPFTKTWVK
jgi:hypothetical protein